MERQDRQPPAGIQKVVRRPDRIVQPVQLAVDRDADRLEAPPRRMLRLVPELCGDRAFDELRKLLTGQQKELEELSKDNGFNQEDMERVQREIEKAEARW